MNFALIVALVLLGALLSSCQHGCQHDCPYYAFIDKSGHVRIRLEPSQDATSFAEGLAAVSRGGLWGYIDTSGAWVIPPRFTTVQEFSEGLAAVGTGEYTSKATRFGFIDRTGKFVIAPQFNLALPFSEGVAAVCTGPCLIPEPKGPPTSWGYINKAGDYVLETRWEHVGPFSEGRAWVGEMLALVGGKLIDYQQPTERLIDHTGRLMSDARFVIGMPFSQGLAVTDKGYVNRAGEVVIPRRLVGESFADGWAATAQGGQAVFIDTAGKVVLRTGYQYAESFSEGLAPACKNDREYENGWGYIDRTGKFAIPPQFHHDSLGPFRNGLALVRFGTVD